MSTSEENRRPPDSEQAAAVGLPALEGAPGAATKGDVNAGRQPPLGLWIVLLLVPTILGLLASAMLVVDYSHPIPLFCDDHGGCEAVRKTPFAMIPYLGVPTPFLGLAAYAVFAVLLFVRGAWGRTLHWALAVIGAVLAVLFITVQFRIGAFCKYCMAVDLASIVLLAGAIRKKLGRWDPPRGRPLLASSAIVLSLAVAAPLALGFIGEEPIPGVISAELKKVPAGKVLVVDFADFECPHCRRVHEKLKSVLPSYGEKVQLVRRHVPLPHVHPNAENAARAALCADEQGRGERMADLLFSEQPSKLTKEGCEALALASEMNLDIFRACVASTRPTERIASDKAMFKEAHGLGLPTVWIGRRNFRGSGFEEADYRAAIEQALQKK